MKRNPPHLWLLNIQSDAKRTFDSLPPSVKQGIFRRLRDLLNADDPYSFSYVEMLKAQKFDRIRKFRVGDFRVFFVVETTPVTYQKHEYKGTLFLLAIRNRKDAY